MNRYKVTVEYDGSNYCGWQVQPNGISIETVIEEALFKITKVKTPIVGSGRTDAGVHAYGQVFHFDSDLKMSVRQWLPALNANLPDDIKVIKVEKVDDNFHARYDALWKEYDYLINVGEYDPFKRNYVYQYNRPLDVKAMRQASRYFIGTHNFTAFNANPLSERPDQTRTIYKLAIKENKGIITIRYVGNGFMRYMVRMMTQTLIEVGKGKIKPERIEQLLDNAVKHSAPYNARPEGLYLVKVGYEEYSEEV
jgi:tRNA pseudouridine38-40 synthase